MAALLAKGLAALGAASGMPSYRAPNEFEPKTGTFIESNARENGAELKLVHRGARDQIEPARDAISMLLQAIGLKPQRGIVSRADNGIGYVISFILTPPAPVVSALARTAAAVLMVGCLVQGVFTPRSAPADGVLTSGAGTWA